MSSEKDIADIKATLAVHTDQLTAQGVQLAAQGAQLTAVGVQLATQGAQIDSIKTTLSQMLPMLMRLLENQARVDERLAHQPDPAEFYELRGRVEEISRRLPTTLAYPQPPQRQS
jgi:hypothetical protein